MESTFVQSAEKVAIRFKHVLEIIDNLIAIFFNCNGLFHFDTMLYNIFTRKGFIMDFQQDHIQLGPIDDSILTLQSQHRSQAVWFDIDQVYYKLM